MDLIFVVALVAFFAVALAFVRACDRVIGPDTDLLRAGGAGPVDPVDEVSV